MTDKKPKRPPETDPIQSERFRQLVRDLEAGGELNPTEAEATMDKLISTTSAVTRLKAKDS
jgi:hypothetical protein